MIITVQDFGILFKARGDGEVPHIFVSLDNFREFCELISALGDVGIISSNNRCNDGAAVTISFNEKCILEVSMGGQSYEEDIPM